MRLRGNDGTVGRYVGTVFSDDLRVSAIGCRSVGFACENILRDPPQPIFLQTISVGKVPAAVIAEYF